MGCVAPAVKWRDEDLGISRRVLLALRSPANAVTMWAIRLGIPRPPYTRRNAVILETIGRRSGKRRRVPVGFVETGGKLVVVAENGQRSDWVLNALKNDGRLRVYFQGQWRHARLRVLDDDAEDYLLRMNRLHAALVHAHSTELRPVEITWE